MKARTLLMTAAAFIMAATAANAEVVASGNCGAEGNNVTWTLDDQGYRKFYYGLHATLGQHARCNK